MTAFNAVLTPIPPMKRNACHRLILVVLYNSTISGLYSMSIGKGHNNDNNNVHSVHRRRSLSVIGTAVASMIHYPMNGDALAIDARAQSKSNILSSRLTSDILYQPKVKQTSEMNLFTGSNGLYDDLFYPPWMAGEWDAYQTLNNYQAPLGKKFLSGPSGLREDVADATIKQQQSLIGKTVGPFRLRFIIIDKKSKKILSEIPTDNNDFVVVEDRQANLRSRANAFAGRDIVKNIEYVEIGGANTLNYGEAPLPTTLLRYKGPAIQKTFSNNRESEIESVDGTEMWTGFESTRILFARKDIDLPPIVSDTEVITQLGSPQLQVTSDGAQVIVVVGKLRIAGYLNPNDALYFDARQRAVTLSDYDLKLVKS